MPKIIKSKVTGSAATATFDNGVKAEWFYDEDAIHVNNAKSKEDADAAVEEFVKTQEGMYSEFWHEGHPNGNTKKTTYTYHFWYK
jgi:hypothetical protein